MKLNPEFREEYLIDWPSRYYELDPEIRLCALCEQLRRNPDSRSDQRRLELFQLRYDDRFNDRFLNAWMMLKVCDNVPAGFLLKRKQNADIRNELSRLCIGKESPDEPLKAEWKNFADMLIRMYANSPSYRSAVFGMGSVSDRNTAYRLAHEIETVTKTVPARVSLEEAAQPFRSALLERYKDLIPNGETILSEIQSI